MPSWNDDEPTFRCTLCEKQFTSKKKLSVHVYRLHGTTSVPHMCSICNVMYKNKESLKTHIHRYHRNQWNRNVECLMQGLELLKVNEQLAVWNSLLGDNEKFGDSERISTSQDQNPFQIPERPYLQGFHLWNPLRGSKSRFKGNALRKFSGTMRSTKLQVTKRTDSLFWQ